MRRPKCGISLASVNFLHLGKGKNILSAVVGNQITWKLEGLSIGMTISMLLVGQSIELCIWKDYYKYNGRMIGLNGELAVHHCSISCIQNTWLCASAS